jgi:hypothetical protein
MPHNVDMCNKLFMSARHARQCDVTVCLYIHTNTFCLNFEMLINAVLQLFVLYGLH